MEAEAAAPRVQLDPFQFSTSGASVPFELMFSMEMPTPMHCSALAQLEPSTMSSAPVPGVVATYQPDVAAPVPVWVKSAPAPMTATVREQANRAALRLNRR